MWSRHYALALCLAVVAGGCGEDDLSRDLGTRSDLGSVDADLGGLPDDGGARDGSTDLDAAADNAIDAVNIVDAAAFAEVRDFLAGTGDSLALASQAFYASYGDDYDFLYLVADVAEGTGRYTRVRSSAIPEVGVGDADHGATYGSASNLKGAIALRLGIGNGPTLHETLHHWGVFLDASLGFGRDATMNFGPHWGVASVFGQHGGFQADTLRCADGGPLPCAADTGGRIQLRVAEFGPAANGGDSIAYAPIELYLMGLRTHEGLDDIVLLRDANFVSQDDGTGDFFFDTAGTTTLTIAELGVAQGGFRATVPEAERHFRGAFVFVSASPATVAQMDAVSQWSRVFGDREESSLLSFEDATGGLGTMDTRIAAR